MKRLMMKISVLVVVFLTIISIVSGCAVMNCITRCGWKDVYNYFSDENSKINNFNLKAVVGNIIYAEEPYLNLELKLTVDYEDFKYKYESDEKFSDGSLKWESDLRYFNKFYFEIVDKNLRILKIMVRLNCWSQERK